MYVITRKEKRERENSFIVRINCTIPGEKLPKREKDIIDVALIKNLYVLS